VNPQYNTSIFATVTQPLLRNFGMEITKTPMKIAEQNEITANDQLRVKIMDIALQVEQSYWDLVYYRDQLKVSQQSLARAKELYDNNKKQVEVGTMAPLEVVAAEAEVASRQEGIITAQRLIRNTEDLLKTLVLGREVARSWPVEVIPTDTAELKSLQFSEDDAIKKAMSDNPDLKVLESDLVTRQLNTRLASNELKPQLDFKGQFGLSGLGGTNPTWSVGVVLGIPIGNSAAKADYVKADLTRKQSETVLENAKQNLIVNIRISMRNMANDIESYASAKAARVLQEKKLDAERKKLEVGLSTNYIVLQYQDDLAQAQSRELLYITDYSKNRAQLKRYLAIADYLKTN
jgi:outer membrane protein TolC